MKRDARKKNECETKQETKASWSILAENQEHTFLLCPLIKPHHIAKSIPFQSKKF